jgi:nicotinate-nucleotide pyrophosphorylase (carboxylating)
MVVTHELDLDRIALSALAEDVGRGDATTEATVAEDATCTGRVLLKEPGVVCGLPAVEAVFRTLDPNVTFEPAADGDRFSEPTELARISGRTRAVLTGERTALNILGRMSGIATLTRCFVDAIEGTGAEILDTRKTTPGLRALEKYAVRCGGGRNHRFGLDDGILVKDNHLRAAGGVRPAVELLRAAGTGLPIEVEAETLSQPAPSRSCSTTCPRPSCARPSSSSTARRRSRPPAASRSTPCARSRRPESTSSRSER